MNRNRRITHMRLVKETHEQPHMKNVYDEYGVMLSKRVTKKRRKNAKGKYIEPVWIGNTVIHGCS